MKDEIDVKKSNKLHYSMPPIDGEDKGEIHADESVNISHNVTKIEQMAARSAKERARAAKWDLNIALFLFAILIIIVILLSQDIGLEVVAPIALFGLATVWFIGWRRGRKLYPLFLHEELSKLEQMSKKTAENKITGEDVDELVRKSLSERIK